MKSQKLKPQDIKAGDRIIAISKSGKTRAIVEVSNIDHERILTTEINGLYFNTYDFFICPPAFTIVPNMMVIGSNIPYIQIGSTIDEARHFLLVYKNYKGYIRPSNADNKDVVPIPDEPEYKEITIAEIEAKFGCKVKIKEAL